MSPTCPKCGASLKDDYGMATCPSCGSILFIDMEGMAHMSSDIPEEDSPPHVAEPSSQNDLSNDSPFFDPLESIGAQEATEPPPEDQGYGFPAPFEEVANEPVSSSQIEVGSQDEIGSQDGTPLGFEPGAPEGDFSMDAFLGYQPPEAANAGPGQASTNDPGADDIGPAGDPLGLSGYANSELSQAKDGPLLFRVLISGIDSKEMRESLREAMEDSRFAWDTDEIMSRISKGSLSIEHVSPVKASILINRIKRMPLKIRWEQYSVTQMESP